jgi:hypothetical protein
MDHHHASGIAQPKRFSRRLTSLLAQVCLALGLLTVPLLAKNESQHETENVPDATALPTAVIRHERAVELEPQPSVFEDDVTVCAIDGAVQQHAVHTETHYFNVTGYHPFALHITTDGKSLSIPFSEMLGRSRLAPLQSSELDGTPVIAFSFEPQSPIAKHGDAENRMAGDLKEIVWINPNDAFTIRFEFRTVLPISLVWGYLGRIDSLEGSLEMMQKAAGNVWLPARQKYVTQGKNAVLVVVGVRFSKSFRTQQTDELERYAANFDIVRAEPSALPLAD